jgi:hypothetical protein
MEGICCGYYDEELDQDIPFEPDKDEAIAAFRCFSWKNIKPSSKMKLLMFQTPGREQASLLVSSLEKDRWDVSASAYMCRRFLGPFFKKKKFRLFVDLCASEVEDLIEILFSYSLVEYAAFLDGAETP